MNHAPATAAPTNRPEGDGAGVPPGISRLLFFLNWIVRYGRNLADNLHHYAADTGNFSIFADRYRRPEVREILARIRRGLMLAAALEEKLRKRAATGRDLTPVPYRSSEQRKTQARPASERKKIRYINLVDLPPDRLPTAAQIALELRRRPIGAIIVDICRDVGVQPGEFSRAEWEELSALITRYGGDVLTLLFRERRLRLKRLLEAELARWKPAPADPAEPGREAPAATGPPPTAQAA